MFFSVKKPLKIMGKGYIPCVCYEVTKVLEATVNHLVEEGTAVIYKERVHFNTGKIIERNVRPRKAKAKKVEEIKVEEKEEIKLETEDTEGF